jgi:outer membrane protein insertion porin family
LANDGALHQINLEVTIPGSDLQYARLNYTNQIYWPITQSREWVIGLRANLGYGIGYGESDELPFFNNFFAGGLIRGGGQLRGYEENSLGPSSTAGARYLTEPGITLARDDVGNILRNRDGTARINNDYGYQTQTLLDSLGTPILDARGTEQIQLAIQNFYLDDDYDSFGGNILAVASLELLFPLPFVPDRNRVRSSFFVDAGNVFSSSCTERQSLLKNCSDFDIGELRYAAGLSVTYLSPFGPLTFYVAAPFGDKEGDDTKTFDFTVGTGF